MKREEIKTKLEKLEGIRWMLFMKDHWEMSDYEKDNNLRNEIKNLKKILKNA